MSFAAPWALLGLLALPLLWWLHKRLKRPPVIALPSLMFLQDEAEAHTLPRGRRIDAELLLTLGAALCLVLGAAGLTIVRGARGRTVRVVVASGVPAQAEGYADRVRGALAEMRGALESADRIEVVSEPPGELGASGRPSVESLLAAARAGAASLRVVISDQAPGTDPGDVAWIGIGDADASNQGIVAAHVVGDGDATGLFVNVLNESTEDARFVVVLGSPEDGVALPPQRLPRHPLRSVTLAVPSAPPRIEIQLAGPDGDAWRDALRVDDRVILTREPLPVFLSAALPVAHRARVRAALTAALSQDGFTVRETPDRAALAVVARGETVPGARLTLDLEPAGEDAAVERAPPGGDGIGRGPVVRDLSTAGVDWVYRAGSQVVAKGETILLARGAGDAWPVVLQSGRRIRLAPDPSRGEPPAVDGPFWPILIDNLVRLAGGGRDAGAGYRAQGVLDADASRLGRAQIPFDPTVLDRARPAAVAEARTLRPLFTIGALVLLALLWAAPWLRRRLDRGRRAPALLPQ